MFPCSLVRTEDEVEQKWCLSYHCEFLGVLRSNFLMFQHMLRSPTREQRSAITALNFVALGIEIWGFCR